MVRLLRLKNSRATPRASAEIRVHASNARSAVADATVAAIAEADARIVVAARTAVADVPIAVAAPSPVALGSNDAPAPVAHDTTAAIREAVPAHRAVRSSFPKC